LINNRTLIYVKQQASNYLKKIRKIGGKMGGLLKITNIITGVNKNKVS